MRAHGGAVREEWIIRCWWLHGTPYSEGVDFILNVSRWFGVALAQLNYLWELFTKAESNLYNWCGFNRYVFHFCYNPFVEQKIQELIKERKLLTAGLKTIIEDIEEVENQALDKDAIVQTRGESRVRPGPGDLWEDWKQATRSLAFFFGWLFLKFLCLCVLGGVLTIICKLQVGTCEDSVPVRVTRSRLGNLWEFGGWDFGRRDLAKEATSAGHNAIKSTIQQPFSSGKQMKSNYNSQWHPFSTWRLATIVPLEVMSALEGGVHGG